MINSPNTKSLLYSIHCILYTVHYTLYTVHCTHHHHHNSSQRQYDIQISRKSINFLKFNSRKYLQALFQDPLLVQLK